MSLLQDNKFLKRKSFFGGILRLPFKLIPDSAVLPILRGPLQGKKWIKGSHNLSNLFGDYEVGQSTNFIKHTKGTSILWDLGAHVGHYSLLYLTNNKAGQVFAFEPDQRNYTRFEKHMRLNSCKHYQMFPVAVSDKEQVLRFVKSRSSVAGKLSDDGELEVQAVRLSSWLRDGKVKPADVIKMDIEGAEYSVLNDLSDFLRSNNPVIFLSTHGQHIHDQCLAFLKGLGYNITPLDSTDLVKAREVMAKK